MTTKTPTELRCAAIMSFKNGDVEEARRLNAEADALDRAATLNFAADTEADKEARDRAFFRGAVGGSIG